jgi:hypothetical protein
MENDKVEVVVVYQDSEESGPPGETAQPGTNSDGDKGTVCGTKHQVLKKARSKRSVKQAKKDSFRTREQLHENTSIRIRTRRKKMKKRS